MRNPDMTMNIQASTATEVEGGASPLGGSLLPLRGFRPALFVYDLRLGVLRGLGRESLIQSMYFRCAKGSGRSIIESPLRRKRITPACIGCAVRHERIVDCRV